METLHIPGGEQGEAMQSPLAGDINWMETPGLVYESTTTITSPLAGDINWMETGKWISENNDNFFYEMSPLAGDINWMETPYIGVGSAVSKSPLAGDINWMETLFSTHRLDGQYVPTRWGH